MGNPMFRALSFLAILAVLGACATAPAGPAKRSKVPEPNLPVSAFIDSAALHQALLTAPPVPPELTLKPLFSVLYDSTGTLATVEPISKFVMPAEWGGTIAALLRQHVAPRLSARKGASEIVWLVSGATPRIAVIDAAVEARPRLQNTAQMARELDALAQRLVLRAPYLGGGSYTAEVAAAVDGHGIPLAPYLVRRSADPEINREMLEIAKKMRFSPALLEGYPVKVLVQIPLTVVLPAPPGETSTGRP